MARAARLIAGANQQCRNQQGCKQQHQGQPLLPRPLCPAQRAGGGQSPHCCRHAGSRSPRLCISISTRLQWMTNEYLHCGIREVGSRSHACPTAVVPAQPLACLPTPCAAAAAASPSLGQQLLLSCRPTPCCGCCCCLPLLLHVLMPAHPSSLLRLLLPAWRCCMCIQPGWRDCLWSVLRCSQAASF